MLQSVGLQRVGHDWATELNWRTKQCGRPGDSDFRNKTLFIFKEPTVQQGGRWLRTWTVISHEKYFHGDVYKVEECVGALRAGAAGRAGGRGVQHLGQMCYLFCYLQLRCWRNFSVGIPRCCNHLKKKKHKCKLLPLCLQSWLGLSHVQLFVTPWTIARQAPLSMGFPRQEYWSGSHSLLQRIFPTQGSNPGLLRFRQILYLLNHQPPFTVMNDIKL